VFCFSVIAALGPDTYTSRPATEPDGPTGVLFEEELDTVTATVQKPAEDAAATKSTSPVQKPYRLQIRWRNVFLLGYLHLAALYGAYLLFASAKLLTIVYGEICDLFYLRHKS